MGSRGQSRNSGVHSYPLTPRQLRGSMSAIDRRKFLLTTGVVIAGAALAPRRSPLWAASDAAYRFPKDFYWGASTAAAQVEGSPSADGGGDSIWDVFLRTPNATKDGSNNLI